MKLFHDNGLRMFAFTTKHHDGFSMFDTKTRVTRCVNWAAAEGPKIEPCDRAYSIVETPFHRDVVAELVAAARRHGIKIDFYFSHPDWYDADFRPYTFSPITTPGNTKQPELYGRTDVGERTKFFFSAPDPTDEEEGSHDGAPPPAAGGAADQLWADRHGLRLDMWLGARVWPQLRETIKLARKLQPNVMLRARGIGNYGDYYTPEGFVPGNPENTAMPWFVIYPLGRSFSYGARPGTAQGRPVDSFET